jgi:hypothetical protein
MPKMAKAEDITYLESKLARKVAAWGHEHLGPMSKTEKLQVATAADAVEQVVRAQGLSARLFFILTIALAASTIEVNEEKDNGTD